MSLLVQPVFLNFGVNRQRTEKADIEWAQITYAFKSLLQNNFSCAVEILVLKSYKNLFIPIF